MADVHDVASYIMRRVGPTTTLKLQKLVYYVQAWSLVLRRSPMFENAIRAWTHGPCVGALYLKHKGMRQISDWPYGDADNISDQNALVIDYVLAIYGHKSPEQLRDMTHEEGPWRETRHGLADDEWSDREIDLETIARYYNDNKFKIAGRAYQEGRVSLHGVASILELSRSDTVALLEEHGYNRPVSAIKLTDRDRALILGKLRAERLRRAGRRETSEASVARSVIATQRIEGVDARPWFKR